ncbi:MAG: ribosome-associated translation inhibitor RaiA [Pseudomonadota bacterium]
MVLIISGQNIALGKYLNDYVEQNLPNQLDKFIAKNASTHVVFKKIKNRFRCEIIVHDRLGCGKTITAKRVTYNAYDSFNLAVSAILRQAKYVKSKRVDHHNYRQQKERLKQQMLAG